ncbi:MAG: hypothetical protein RLY61_797 [Candidatus Parcubacteria bacterium]|jgi:serine/threonine protein phosphatase PrpC
MAAAEWIASIAEHAPNTLPTVTELQPDVRQQGNLIAAVLKTTVPITENDRYRVLHNIDAYAQDLEAEVARIARPDQDPKDTEGREHTAEVLKPIQRDFYVANGIQSMDAQGFQEFVGKYPHPRDFAQAFRNYSNRTYIPDPAKLEDALVRAIYGKKLEYYLQLQLLKQEARRNENLTLAKKAGSVLVPGTAHDGRCDDSLTAGPNFFAIADGVGAGGYRSGKLANFMTTRAKEVLSGDPPSTEREAKQALWKVLAETAQEIEKQQREALSLKDQRKSLGDVLSVTSIDTVGAIAVISAEADGHFLNLVNLGSCRTIIIGQDGQIKLITKDRTKLYDESPQGTLFTAAEKRKREAHIVTSSATNPSRLDFYRVPVTKGDTIITVSNGVTQDLDDAELHKYLQHTLAPDLREESPKHTPQEWANGIARSVTAYPPHDDVAVFVSVLDKL